MSDLKTLLQQLVERLPVPSEVPKVEIRIVGVVPDGCRAEAYGPAADGAHRVTITVRGVAPPARPSA